MDGECQGVLPGIGNLGVGQAELKQMEEHTANRIKRQAKRMNRHPIIPAGDDAVVPPILNMSSCNSVRVRGTKLNEQAPTRGNRQGSSAQGQKSGRFLHFLELRNFVL